MEAQKICEHLLYIIKDVTDSSITPILPCSIESDHEHLKPGKSLDPLHTQAKKKKYLHSLFQGHNTT